MFKIGDKVKIIDAMDSSYRGKTRKTEEVFNAFGISSELFKDGSPYKESAEAQLTQFLEINKKR